MDFNSPIIIRYSDSFGNTFFKKQLNKPNEDEFLDLTDVQIRCGDKLRIEIEVDSSFSKDEYTISWNINREVKEFRNSTYFTYEFKEEDVGELFGVFVTVTSNKKWHRYTTYDDRFIITYKVLPPLI